MRNRTIVISCVFIVLNIIMGLLLFMDLIYISLGLFIASLFIIFAINANFPQLSFQRLFFLDLSFLSFFIVTFIGYVVVSSYYYRGSGTSDHTNLILKEVAGSLNDCYDLVYSSLNNSLESEGIDINTLDIFEFKHPIEQRSDSVNQFYIGGKRSGSFDQQVVITSIRTWGCDSLIGHKTVALNKDLSKEYLYNINNIFNNVDELSKIIDNNKNMSNN